MARPYVDVSGAAVVYAYFSRAIVEDYGRSVHFSLERVEPFSRRGLRHPGVTHGRWGGRRAGEACEGRIIVIKRFFFVERMDGWKDG